MVKKIMNTFAQYSVFSVMLVTGLGFSFSATAHSGAMGVVKERMEVMDNIGKDMKKMKAMIKGKEVFNSIEFSKRAKSINMATGKIPKLFPEGSLQEPTEALPSIWKEWDLFSSLADRLANESNKLQDIAQSNDRRAIMRQFASVGKTCRSCHTDYRKKKEKNRK